MKRCIVWVIVSGILMCIALVLLYRHFVTDQIMDKGGKENPFPPETEAEPITVPETAEQVRFSWYQSPMDAGGCFPFDFVGGKVRFEFTNEQTGERIEIGQWSSAIAEESALVSPEQWAELEDFLREADLPAHCEPDPQIELLDETISSISITWSNDNAEFTEECNGEHAHDLLGLVKRIAREIYSAMPESASCP